MAICKDCIHYKCCRIWESNEKYFENVDIYNCCAFIDKSKIIELPCKVGDYVEWDNGLGYKTLKRINGFYYDPNDGGLRFILDDCSPILAVSNITNILTREEAEKALERSINNA